MRNAKEDTGNRAPETSRRYFYTSARFHETHRPQRRRRPSGRGRYPEGARPRRRLRSGRGPGGVGLVLPGTDRLSEIGGHDPQTGCIADGWPSESGYHPKSMAPRNRGCGCHRGSSQFGWEKVTFPRGHRGEGPAVTPGRRVLGKPGKKTPHQSVLIKTAIIECWGLDGNVKITPK